MLLRGIMLTFTNVLVIVIKGGHLSRGSSSKQIGGHLSRGSSSKQIASIKGSEILCDETDKLEKMYTSNLDKYLIRNRKTRVKKGCLKLVSCCENVRWYKYRENGKTQSRITEGNTLTITIERDLSRRRGFLQIQSDVVILGSETSAFLDDFWIMIEKSDTIVFAISPPTNCQDSILGALSEILGNRMICRPLTVAHVSRCAELFLNYVAETMVRKSFSLDEILTRYTSEMSDKINRVKFPRIPVPNVIQNGARVLEATAKKSVDSLQYVARVVEKPAESFGALLSPSAHALGSKIIAKLFESNPNVAETRTDELFEVGTRVANSVDTLLTALESSVHILGNSVVDNSVESIKGVCGEKVANTTSRCLSATKMCALNGTAILLATPIRLAVIFLRKLFDIRRGKIVNESRSTALKGKSRLVT